MECSPAPCASAPCTPALTRPTPGPAAALSPMQCGDTPIPGTPSTVCSSPVWSEPRSLEGWGVDLEEAWGGGEGDPVTKQLLCKRERRRPSCAESTRASSLTQSFAFHGPGPSGAGLPVGQSAAQGAVSPTCPAGARPSWGSQQGQGISCRLGQQQQQRHQEQQQQQQQQRHQEQRQQEQQQEQRQQEQQQEQRQQEQQQEQRQQEQRQQEQQQEQRQQEQRQQEQHQKSSPAAAGMAGTQRQHALPLRSPATQGHGHCMPPGEAGLLHHPHAVKGPTPAHTPCKGPLVQPATCNTLLRHAVAVIDPHVPPHLHSQVC